MGLEELMAEWLTQMLKRSNQAETCKYTNSEAKPDRNLG